MTHHQAIELLACPLCGSTPHCTDAAGWEIFCDCGLSLCLPKPDQGPLIAAWNRRAAPASEPAVDRDSVLEEAALAVEDAGGDNEQYHVDAIRALKYCTTPATPEVPAPAAPGSILVRITPKDEAYTDVHPDLILEDAMRVSPYGWPEGFSFEVVQGAQTQPEEYTEREYEIWQDEMIVAGTAGKRALKEAQHYAMMYSQDGPCEIVEVRRVKVSP